MRGMIRRAIRALDRYLTRRMDALELWDHPDSLFHGTVAEVDRPVDLGDRTLPAGTMVLELHLLNDEMPEIPPGGPSLAWASLAQRRLFRSLQAVARRLETDDRLAPVEAVGGATVLFSNHPDDGNLLHRMGFTVRPYGGAGRFGTLWENVYSWMLMWTYNPGTLRSRSFRSLRRTEAWISREDFLDRFGKADP